MQWLVEEPKLLLTVLAPQLESVWSYLHHDQLIALSGTLVNVSA